MYIDNTYNITYKYVNIDSADFTIRGDAERFLDKYREISDDLLIRLSMVNWITIKEHKKNSQIVMNESQALVYKRQLEIVEIKIVDISDYHRDGYITVTYEPPELPEGFSMSEEYLDYGTLINGISFCMSADSVAAYIASRH